VTLRPLAWIVEHEAYAGRTITFATERRPNETAYVVSLERMPEIVEGTGRVVLSTFTHRDQLLKLQFVGEDQPLETTPSHRIFSIEHDNWIPASELKPGDHVRTRNGKAKIASIEPQEIASVFDLEVESDHSYFIAGTDVLSHNCGSSGPKLKDLLQNKVNQAIEQIKASPKLAKRLMSPGSYAHLRKGDSLYAASFGKAVERQTAKLAQADKELRSMIIHTGRARGPNGRFISSPDFTPVQKRISVFDVTTKKDLGKHTRRYGNRRVQYLLYEVVYNLDF